MISDIAKSDKGRGRLLAALGILVLTPDGLLIRYGQLSTRQVRARATCARARLFVQRGSRRANSVPSACEACVPSRAIRAVAFFESSDETLTLSPLAMLAHACLDGAPPGSSSRPGIATAPATMVAPRI